MAYIDFHPTIHEMGDEACAAAIIEGTITAFEDNSLQILSAHALSNAEGLKSLNLPVITQASLSAAYNTGISSFIVGPKFLMGTHFLFANCENLKEVIIVGGNYGAPIILNAATAFDNTPIANGTGYIYVPKNLYAVGDGVAAYEAATNWSAFAGQFRAIEDYPEILAIVKEKYPWY